MDTKYRMESKDVQEIIREVDVNVYKVINLKELEPYMVKWFLTGTFQNIQADIRNNGQCYAVVNFLESVRMKPSTFPKLMAALKHTEQTVVYQMFMTAIKKCFRNKPVLDQILSLIKEEEKEQSGELDDVHVRHSASSSPLSSGSGATQLDSGRNPSHDTSAANDERETHRDCPMPHRDNQGTVGSRVQSDTELEKHLMTASVSSMSLDSNIPATRGLEKGKNLDIQLLQKRAEPGSVQLTSQTSQKPLPFTETEQFEAVRAQSDQINTQINPGKYAHMSQDDQVHQRSRDIQGELCDDRGQISNQSSTHNSSVNPSTQSASDNPNGSGHMLRFRHIDLSDSDNEDQIKDHSFEPRGVVHVSPRENNTNVAGVTIVSPNESMGPVEVPTVHFGGQQEAESNLTSANSSDAHDVEQLTDQGTDESDSENVTCYIKRKTEK